MVVQRSPGIVPSDPEARHDCVLTRQPVMAVVAPPKDDFLAD